MACYYPTDSAFHTDKSNVFVTYLMVCFELLAHFAALKYNLQLIT